MPVQCFFTSSSFGFAFTVGLQNGSVISENSSGVLQNVEHGTAYDPAIPRLGVEPRELKTYVTLKLVHGFSLAALTTAQKLK